MSENMGILLRRHRRDAGLTLEELAEASGVSARAISDMERGRSLGPQRRTMAALAGALNLPPEEQAALLGAAKAGRSRERPGTPPAGAAEPPRLGGEFVGRAGEL